MRAAASFHGGSQWLGAAPRRALRVHPGAAPCPAKITGITQRFCGSAAASARPRGERAPERSSGTRVHRAAPVEVRSARWRGRWRPPWQRAVDAATRLAPSLLNDAAPVITFTRSTAAVRARRDPEHPPASAEEDARNAEVTLLTSGLPRRSRRGRFMPTRLSSSVRSRRTPCLTRLPDAARLRSIPPIATWRSARERNAEFGVLAPVHDVEGCSGDHLGRRRGPSGAPAICVCGGDDEPAACLAVRSTLIALPVGKLQRCRRRSAGGRLCCVAPARRATRRDWAARAAVVMK